jgi:hypothetical protein
MPGLLLRLVREAYPGVEVLISVPNAAADGCAITWHGLRKRPRGTYGLVAGRR